MLEGWETRPAPAPPGPPQDRVGGPRLHHYLLTAAATWLLLALLDSQPAAYGEPLALRWLRTASDHPIRTILAASLALRALGPRTRRL